jgi:hypothetical protein
MRRRRLLLAVSPTLAPRGALPDRQRAPAGPTSRHTKLNGGQAIACPSVSCSENMVMREISVMRVAVVLRSQLVRWCEQRAKRPLSHRAGLLASFEPKCTSLIQPPCCWRRTLSNYPLMLYGDFMSAYHGIKGAPRYGHDSSSWKASDD